MPIQIKLLNAEPFEAAFSNDIQPRDLLVQYGRVLRRVIGGMQEDFALRPYLCGDFADLLRVQQMEQPNGFEPLLPFLVPDTAPNLAGRWLAMVDDQGFVRATVASLATYIPERETFRTVCEDLSLFLAAPQVARDMGAYATCSAPTAPEISGHVTVLSGGWVHPKWRKRGLIGAAVRLLIMAAYGFDTPDWVVGLIAPDLPIKLTADGYRFPRRDSEIVLNLPGWPLTRFTLGALKRCEVEARLIEYRPARPEPTVDEVEAARRWWLAARTDAAGLASAAE
jgi:hypothetical protein